MAECKIKLNAAEEVCEFVNAAERCDFEIDIFYNRVVVDAKSLLGILSMDLNQPLTVQSYGSNPNFNRVLSKFAIA